MKKNLVIATVILTLVSGLYAFRSSQTAYDYQLVTTIESVVPGGLGRSRMITSAVDGAMEEKEMKNFFSLTGINFKNVKENDKMITDKVTEMTMSGWELVNVTSGVYSPGVGSDAVSTGAGIFITRYLFKKQK